jgi:flagellar hook assembly protein FlgD
MGDLFSLGVSNAFNLSTNVSDIVTYNNILGPSNGQAIIKYDVLSAGDLSIKIYTVTGSLVKIVYDGPVPAGKGTMDWDGTNEKGSKVASGIYYVKAKGPDLDKTDKIAVVR